MRVRSSSYHCLARIELRVVRLKDYYMWENWPGMIAFIAIQRLIGLGTPRNTN